MNLEITFWTSIELQKDNLKKQLSTQKAELDGITKEYESAKLKHAETKSYLVRALTKIKKSKEKVQKQREINEQMELVKKQGLKRTLTSK